MPDWLATTVTLVAGGTLTMLAGWLADWRLSTRERERRGEERRDRLLARRNEFQRETLLALQVASQKLLRNAGASFYQDILAYRTTGNWQKQKLPGDLSDDHLRLTTETMLLASRVRDEEVRRLADRLRENAAAVTGSTDERAAESQMMAAAATQNTLINRIGELVRALDETD